MSEVPFFVVNPNAANRRLARAWPAIADRLRNRLGPFEHGLTAGPGDATRLTREAVASGHRLIVSCGGDGTNNEVLNGLLEPGQRAPEGLTLGLLPFGTGGDLRRTLGIGQGVDDAIERLCTGRERLIDVGCVEHEGEQPGTTERRAFLNIAGGGLDGLVVRYVNRTSKALGGKLSFNWATVRALWDYDFPPIRVEVDGQLVSDEPSTFVAVANGQFFGGGMHVAPEAALDDGLFDVVVARRASFLRQFLTQRDLYKGRHLRHPWYAFARGREVRIASPRIPLDVDGEAPGFSPARFTLIERALQLRG